MTPGTYLARRRVACGLDHVDVAMAIASPVLEPEAAGLLLLKLEADQVAEGRTVEHMRVINALEQAIRFDPAVYWALVLARTDPRTIVPPICRECACTWKDPCPGDRGACSWANAGSGEEPLCTQCRDAAASSVPSSAPAAVAPAAPNARRLLAAGEPWHAA